MRRQRDGKEWTKLPAVGRLGAAPEWPLAIPAPSEDEELLWRDVWTLPQAIIWEMDRSHQLVAFYVRTYLEAMHTKAGAQARMFVRQLSNDLYLAPAALASGRYVIEGTDDAAAIDAAVASHQPGTAGPRRRGPGKKSARDRLQVVDSGPTENEEVVDPDEAKDDEGPQF